MSTLNSTIATALAVAVTSIAATNAVAGPVFSSSNYSADIVFQDALGSTTMTIAHDGSHYWSASGGSSSGNRYAQYDASGNLISAYAPGIDFRSVFTDNSGSVYARGFASNTIYQQTIAGVFTSYLTLSGGSLDAQSAVVKNGNGDFVAMNNGLVNIWNASGAFVTSFNLSGYINGYPQNRGVAVADNYLFTYYDQVLSAWDYSGNLLDQATLSGAGTSFDSYFSLSYTNNRVFVVDTNSGAWRGYNVGLTNNAVPEPATFALIGLGFTGLVFSRRKRKA